MELMYFKKKKLPRLYLKLHGYKLENENDKTIMYQKRIITKDEYNYGAFYYIQILQRKSDNSVEVFATYQHYVHEWEDWGYRIYENNDKELLLIITKYDRKLLKYIK